MSSDATDLPDLLGCWVTLSSAGFCLTALSSRYWQSFHTAFQRLPNSQKKWHHSNLPLGEQGSWGPWRQMAEVAIRGGMAMLGPIHCRIVTSSGWMDFFSLLSRGFASLCLLQRTSVRVWVKPLSCSTCSETHQLLTPLRTYCLIGLRLSLNCQSTHDVFYLCDKPWRKLLCSSPPHKSESLGWSDSLAFPWPVKQKFLLKDTITIDYRFKWWRW